MLQKKKNCSSGPEGVFHYPEKGIANFLHSELHNLLTDDEYFQQFQNYNIVKTDIRLNYCWFWHLISSQFHWWPPVVPTKPWTSLCLFHEHFDEPYVDNQQHAFSESEHISIQENHITHTSTTKTDFYYPQWKDKIKDKISTPLLLNFISSSLAFDAQLLQVGAPLSWRYMDKSLLTTAAVQSAGVLPFSFRIWIISSTGSVILFKSQLNGFS